MAKLSDLESVRGRPDANSQYLRDLPGILSRGASPPIPPSLNMPAPRAEPQDPLVDTFGRRWPLYPMENPGVPVAPGTQERFGDPTKVISDLPEGYSFDRMAGDVVDRTGMFKELQHKSYDRQTNPIPVLPIGPAAPVIDIRTGKPAKHLGELPEGYTFDRTQMAGGEQWDNRKPLVPGALPQLPGNWGYPGIAPLIAPITPEGLDPGMRLRIPPSGYGKKLGELPEGYSFEKPRRG